ncbi:MAG TPA: branched-chain amino acid ABC transporter substrate-binding protein [Acidimicrobiales bacterium]|nr:branched-chain amino acid ABC transporter substrate-binding protein [Acidimicrobiales bacterium]
MRKLLMKTGVPIVAGALALTGVAVSAASASTVKPHPAVPTYTIAYEGPLSGGVAQLGLNMKFAVQLAINQANAGTTFGKLGFKLKFLPKDDQGSGTVSPTIAAQLVANASVLGVVGPAFSGATAAAEPTFSSAHLATVSPSATRISLATSGWHNFFRVVADDGIQGPKDANYVVKKLKFKKIYVVSDQTLYGAGLASAFGTQASSDGATLTNANVPSTTNCGNGGSGNPTQYPAAAAAIKAANDPIVFYGGYYCDLGLLLGALHNAGYTGKVMSGDGSDDPHLILGTNPKTAANGVYLTCPCAQLGTTAADKAFGRGFTKLAHFAPGTYSTDSYDATNTIIAVMKSLWSAGGHKETRANIVNALHKVIYKGLAKTIRFQADGNLVGGTIFVNQVVKGKIVQIGPE